VSSPAKFEGEAAEAWSDDAYADTEAYLSHRAELACSLGPPLLAGDRVLDLACGDARFAEYLLPRGLSYVGVDASSSMVAAARRRLGQTVEIVHAELDGYTPSSPVSATMVFRAVYYARDRAAFFRRVGEFTEKKLVFDLSPRRYRLDEVRSELSRAGFTELDLHPFFVPQRYALPPPLPSLFLGAERVGLLARLILRLRFSYICSASRNDR
jgi:SAM-dependent methyltransferase